MGDEASGESLRSGRYPQQYYSRVDDDQDVLTPEQVDELIAEIVTLLYMCNRSEASLGVSGGIFVIACRVCVQVCVRIHIYGSLK
jgi:hypothetical protein